MADTVNETLVDEFLRHQIYLERFKLGNLRDLQTFLRQLQDDVSGQLGKRLTDVTTQGTVNTQRLIQLLKELEEISDELTKTMQEAQTLQLKQLAQYESDWTLSTMKSTIQVSVSFNTISPAQLWAAVNARPFEGRELKQWFKDYSVSQKQRITSAVKMSVIEGETVDQTIRRIRGTKSAGYTDGVVNGVTRRSAETLARTAISHVVQAARQATFEDNDEVISALKWHATLDKRTSLVCITRDGKIFPLDTGPRPPAHPNCRSTMIPVVKSWQELGINMAEAPPGTRASMDGQVPADVTYAEWLRRQPVAFQNDVLGKTKGQLFRAGKLDVDQFVDNSGRAYTLDQLRQLHPDAF